jgi:hypothetical protein
MAISRPFGRSPIWELGVTTPIAEIRDLQIGFRTVQGGVEPPDSR